MDNEFYIGWQGQAPKGIGRRVHMAVALFIGAALLLAVLLVLSQRTVGVASFEWGSRKTFTGRFNAQPYPHLLVDRPGARPGASAASAYYLVAPFKFGCDPRLASEFDGQQVSLEGTLIYRGNQTMIEVVPESIKTATSKSEPAAPMVASLGQQTLQGEIVDSKCFLGVMNPGSLTPHRACAVRCISGGIPPVLLVRKSDGSATYYLLVSSEGKPVNKQVLDLVAEPLEITGEVVQQGELLVLRADPATYRRL